MELTIKQQIRKQYRTSPEFIENWWSYLDLMRSRENPETFNILVQEVIDEREAAKKRLMAYKQSDLFRFRIRKYCNYHGYSDIDPCEVIEVVSPRKVIVRQMDAILTQSPVQHIGGFCANTENDTQCWECKSNESNQVIVLTLTKKGWGQGQYRMSNEPKKFYDYNF